MQLHGIIFFITTLAALYPIYRNYGKWGFLALGAGLYGGLLTSRLPSLTRSLTRYRGLTAIFYYAIAFLVPLVGGWLSIAHSQVLRLRKAHVWIAHVGQYQKEGKCYACNAPISYKRFKVAHNIDFKEKGGLDDIPNLRPVCKRCKKEIGNSSISTHGFARARNKLSNTVVSVSQMVSNFFLAPGSKEHMNKSVITTETLEDTTKLQSIRARNL